MHTHSLLNGSFALLLLAAAATPGCDDDGDDTAESGNAGETEGNDTPDPSEGVDPSDSSDPSDGTDPTDTDTDTDTDGVDPSESDSDTDGSDTEPEEQHPLCEACLDTVGPEFPNYECQPELDCGTFYVLGGTNWAPGCVEDERQNLDCSPVEPLNQAVLDCMLEAAAEGLRLTAERNDIPERIINRERRFHSDGEIALDIITNMEGITIEWPAARATEMPDLAHCEGLQDAATGWSCIEAAFDDAETVATCNEAGSFDAR